jgi:hypothetical protein
MARRNTQRAPGIAAQFVERLLEGGRCGFSLGELVRATGLEPIAAQMQIRRIAHVTPLYSRAKFYLAISPEHRRIGAPPVEWWINDFFAALKRPYYIGLLSAAAIHGSSPQAIQVTQIVTDSRRPMIQIGRQRIQFTEKHDAEKTPVMTPRGARVSVKVATPEATFFDLIRYERKLGGMPRILDVIDGLDLSPDGIEDALRQDLEGKLLQRAGFLLEQMGKKTLIRLLAQRLQGIRLRPAPIIMTNDRNALRIEANPWNVVGTLGARSGS